MEQHDVHKAHSDMPPHANEKVLTVFVQMQHVLKLKQWRQATNNQQSNIKFADFSSFLASSIALKIRCAVKKKHSVKNFVIFFTFSRKINNEIIIQINNLRSQFSTNRWQTGSLKANFAVLMRFAADDKEKQTQHNFHLHETFLCCSTVRLQKSKVRRISNGFCCGCTVLAVDCSLPEKWQTSRTNIPKLKRECPARVK